jgi:hypothetical protein
VANVTGLGVTLAGDVATALGPGDLDLVRALGTLTPGAELGATRRLLDIGRRFSADAMVLAARAEAVCPGATAVVARFGPAVLPLLLETGPARVVEALRRVTPVPGAAEWLAAAGLVGVQAVEAGGQPVLDLVAERGLHPAAAATVVAVSAAAERSGLAALWDIVVPHRLPSWSWPTVDGWLAKGIPPETILARLRSPWRLRRLARAARAVGGP